MSWKETYQALTERQRLPKDCTIAELNELATQAALASDFTAKATIMGWIGWNPAATADDRFRVKVYEGDLMRRNGNPATALALLEDLQQGENKPSLPVRLEFYQAKGQCLLMLKRADEALAYQTTLIAALDDSIPVDKQLFYLETVIALKQHAEQFDNQLAGYVDRYERLLERTEFTDDTRRKRAYWALHTVRGELEFAREHFGPAADLFKLAFRYTTAARNAAVSSLEHIAACFRGDLIPEEDFVTFFRGNHTALLPPDITAQQTKYDLVTDRLGIKC